MNRKTLVIGSVIAIAIAAGLVWYFVGGVPQGPEGRAPFGNLPFLGGRGRVGDGGETPSPTPALPPSAQEKLHPVRQVVEKDIIGPTLTTDGESLLYILRENGHVVSSDLDGNNEKSVVNLTVLEVFDAAWSPKKDRVAMRYHEGDTVKSFLNGVATGTTSRFLPPETTALAWSPDGASIAYLVRRNNDTALVIADPANQRPRTAYTTPVPDFTLSWLSKSAILLVSRPSALAPSIVMRFDPMTQRATLLLSNARGVVTAPAPDGNGFLYSQSSPNGQAEPLTLHSFKSGPTTLGALTIAEKCAFSKDAKKLYCGVPKSSIPSPSPDEWYKGAVAFSDAILEVDLASNQATTLMENTADVDVISPFVSPDGKYLFFQDKKTGYLWRLMLKE